MVRALFFFNFLFLSKKATSVTLSNFQVAFSARGRLFSPPLPSLPSTQIVSVQCILKFKPHSLKQCKAGKEG